MNINEYIKSGGMTVAELSSLIGVKSEMQVRQWQHGYSNRKPSPKYCIAIEQATNGVVTCEELRPDIDWSYIRGTHKPGKEEAQ